MNSYALENDIAERCADSLLIIPMFILDFLCIHPFGECIGLTLLHCIFPQTVETAKPCR